MSALPSNRPPLDETYVHSFGRLRSVATRLVSREDADDMVQEAYLRALTNGDRFRGEAAQTTWIHRILVNACLDARRYRQRRGVHVTLEESHMALREGGQGYDVMGYTHPEISRRLGIPVGTSKGRLCAARRRLRRLLAP